MGSLPVYVIRAQTFCKFKLEICGISSPFNEVLT